MSQHDLDIANQGFPATRADINNALQALGSSNSGATAPSTTYANQLWYDTANNIIKIRNEDNDAWISLFTLDQTNDNIEALTIDGTITADALTVDTNTLHVDATNNRVGIGTVSPSQTVEISNDGNAGLDIVDSGSGDPAIRLSVANSAGYVGTTTNHSLRFIANDSEVGRFLSGGGLTFNGDTAAANALDDYEEGTWTPQISATDGIGTLAYGSQIGRYIKVGRTVTFQLYIAISSKGTVAGTIRLTLPFSAHNISTGYQTAAVRFNNTQQSSFSDQMEGGRIHPNESIFRADRKNSSGQRANMTAANLGNTTDFMVTGSYIVA